MAHTHYVTGFTRRNAQGHEETACGQFVRAVEVAADGHTPTCWCCAMWLHSLDGPPRVQPTEPARVLAQITEFTPWGSPMEAA